MTSISSIENTLTLVTNNEEYETPIDSAFGIGDYEDVDNKEFEPDSIVTKAQPFKPLDPAGLPPTIGNYYSNGPSSVSPANSTHTYECPLPTMPRVCLTFLCHPYMRAWSMDSHRVGLICGDNV